MLQKNSSFVIANIGVKSFTCMKSKKGEKSDPRVYLAQVRKIQTKPFHY